MALLNDRQHLQVAENIILLFQPPHEPQVNPIERLWEEIKRHFSWEFFQNLDEFREVIWQPIEKLSTSIVASITGWDFILDASFVSGFS